jgi:hypothetical protein
MQGASKPVVVNKDEFASKENTIGVFPRNFVHQFGKFLNAVGPIRFIRRCGNIVLVAKIDIIFQRRMCFPLKLIQGAIGAISSSINSANAKKNKILKVAGENAPKAWYACQPLGFG